MTVPKNLLQTLRERFERKFTAGKESECWLWTGAKTSTGYGYMAIEIDGKRKEIKAHRLVIALREGRWPDDKVMACHHCDNPPCVNPRHIYAGTASSNSDDKHRRGRYKTWLVKGVKAPSRHIDSATALKILDLYYGKEGNGRIAFLMIHKRQNTVPGLMSDFKISLRTLRTYVLKKESRKSRWPAEAHEIRRKWFGIDGQGAVALPGKTVARWSAESLGSAFGISRNVVAYLVRGRTYPEAWADFKKSSENAQFCHVTCRG